MKNIFKVGVMAVVAASFTGEAIAETTWNVSLWGKRRAFTEHCGIILVTIFHIKQKEKYVRRRLTTELHILIWQTITGHHLEAQKKHLVKY